MNRPFINNFYPFATAPFQNSLNCGKFKGFMLPGLPGDFVCGGKLYYVPILSITQGLLTEELGFNARRSRKFIYFYYQNEFLDY
jgi:hypothetical protein